MYELVMFHAEREEVDSNFKLTLKDFNKPKSTCAPVCGDGIVTRTEVCDDGRNTGEYGGCMPGCKKRGPYCGDGAVDEAHEKCDDGVNLSLTAAAPPVASCRPAATASCRRPSSATTWSSMANTADAPRNAPRAALRRRRGPGGQGEQCDDGNRTSGDDCDNSCTYTIHQLASCWRLGGDTLPASEAQHQAGPRMRA